MLKIITDQTEHPRMHRSQAKGTRGNPCRGQYTLASDSKHKAHSAGVDLAQPFQNSSLFILKFSFHCELLLLLDYLKS